jgi:hypothetical protein
VTEADSTQIPIQRSDAPRLGPAERNSEHDQDGPDATRYDGNHRTKQRCGQSRFERAKFVRCADENIVHGRNAPPHFVWRDELHDGPANDDAHAVKRAEHKQ